MIWGLIGFVIVAGVVSGFVRSKSRNHFQDGIENERILHEEERVKANSWFGG